MHNIHLKTASVLLALCAIAVKAQSTYSPIAPSALVPSEQKLPTQSPQEAPPTVGQGYALTPNPSAAVLPKLHVDLDAEHAYTLPRADRSRGARTPGNPNRMGDRAQRSPDRRDRQKHLPPAHVRKYHRRPSGVIRQ